MTARPFVRTALLLALPLALAGCGGAGDADDVAVGAEPGSGSIEARSSGHVVDRPDGGLVLPLDGYTFSGAEDRVLGRAAEAAVRACAEERGLAAADVEPLPFGASPATGDGAGADAVGQRHERRYAVVDIDVAATFGYHPPATTDVRREFYEAHTEDELRVLVGDGDGGGCLQVAADVTAVGDEATLRAGEQLVSDVQSDAWHRALDDPRVVAAFEAWSACMAESGYQYDAPMEANDDPVWWRSGTASAEEIATATADVACKESTGLIPVWSAVEAEHQAGLIEQNQAAFDDYRAVLDQQVAAARAALR